MSSESSSIDIEELNNSPSAFQKCFENIMQLGRETGVDFDFGGPCGFSQLFMELRQLALDNIKMEHEVKNLEKRRDFLIAANETLTATPESSQKLLNSRKENRLNEIISLSSPEVSPLKRSLRSQNLIHPTYFGNRKRLLSSIQVPNVVEKIEEDEPEVVAVIQAPPKKVIKSQVKDETPKVTVVKKTRKTKLEKVRSSKEKESSAKKVLTRLAARKESIYCRTSSSKKDSVSTKGELCPICQKSVNNEKELQGHIDKAHMRMLRRVSTKY